MAEFFAHVHQPSGRSRGNIAMFHGFPGEGTKQSGDIADALAKETGKTIHRINYSGFGQAPGKFSFQRALSESKALFKALLAQDPSFSATGHSWGGFVLMTCLREVGIPSGKLLFLSPLTYAPKPERIVSIVENSVADFPYLRDRVEPIDFLKAESAQLLGADEPINFAKDLNFHPGQVHIIQAKNDQSIPDATVEAFSKEIKAPHQFEFFESDHSFIANRTAFTQKLIGLLR